MISNDTALEPELTGPTPRPTRRANTACGDSRKPPRSTAAGPMKSSMSMMAPPTRPASGCAAKAFHSRDISRQPRLCTVHSLLKPAGPSARCCSNYMPWRSHLTRRVTFLVSVLTVVFGVCIPGVPLSAASHAAADSPATPPAPTGLTMALASGPRTVAAGGWVSGTRLDLRFHVQVPSGPLVPQVEIVPFDRPFTGHANFTGDALTSSGVADVHISGLENGKTYHWQARTVDTNDVPSSWAQFAPPDATGRRSRAGASPA